MAIDDGPPINVTFQTSNPSGVYAVHAADGQFIARSKKGSKPRQSMISAGSARPVMPTPLKSAIACIDARL